MMPAIRLAFAAAIALSIVACATTPPPPPDYGPPPMKRPLDAKTQLETGLRY